MSIASASKPGRDTILVVPPSCLTVLQERYPIAAYPAAVPERHLCIHSCGRHRRPGSRAQKKKETTKVGLGRRRRHQRHRAPGPLSGPASAGKIHGICDNEAYMNTGLSGPAPRPRGSSLTTTPFSGSV
ncbi:MAG: hypothetical protein R2874_01980 [Desulfobacterales bacterium]